MTLTLKQSNIVHIGANKNIFAKSVMHEIAYIFLSMTNHKKWTQQLLASRYQYIHSFGDWHKKVLIVTLSKAINFIGPIGHQNNIELIKNSTLGYMHGYYRLITY